MLHLFKVKPYQARAINEESYIPQLKDLTHKTIENRQVYPSEAGNILLRGLLKDPDLGVLLCEMPEGTDFPEHQHVVVEWLMVSKGELAFTLSTGETTVLKAGDFIQIQPGQSHTSIALTDVKVLAVTMPTDEGFPDEQPRQG
jgi:quercetin dioxygenase-like cupin family protein